MRSCLRCGGKLFPTISTTVIEHTWTASPDPAILKALLRRTESEDRIAESRAPLREMTPIAAKQIFVSYLHTDAQKVERLRKGLASKGFTSWVDREQLLGGDRWKKKIKDAIADGGAVVGCFSSTLDQRTTSYMHEELTVIVEQMRLRSTERPWFIPVRLDACTIPDRNIGGGETLRDIQSIDMFSDWKAGVNRLVRSLKAAGL